ncbi:MAG: nucleotidyltransferase domain-containing protein [Bacteroidia bacterium]
MVNPVITKNIKAIQALCLRHHVVRLWVFGSVLRDDFNQDSDIDFLYEWDDEAIIDNEYLSNLWTLLDSLEALLGHSVDWIYYPNLKNPYFIEEVEETKFLIYDQKQEEIPV